MRERRLCDRESSRHGIPDTVCDYVEGLVNLSRSQVADTHVRDPAEFTVRSAEALPFPDASRYLSSRMEVLEHLHHPDRALAEFRCVTLDGARPVISVPIRQNGFQATGMWSKVTGLKRFRQLVEVTGWRCQGGMLHASSVPAGRCSAANISLPPAPSIPCGLRKFYFTSVSVASLRYRRDCGLSERRMPGTCKLDCRRYFDFSSPTRIDISEKNHLMRRRSLKNDLCSSPAPLYAQTTRSRS